MFFLVVHTLITHIVKLFKIYSLLNFSFNTMPHSKIKCVKFAALEREEIMQRAILKFIRTKESFMMGQKNVLCINVGA